MQPNSSDARASLRISTKTVNWNFALTTKTDNETVPGSGSMITVNYILEETTKTGNERVLWSGSMITAN